MSPSLFNQFLTTSSGFMALVPKSLRSSAYLVVNMVWSNVTKLCTGCLSRSNKLKLLMPWQVSQNPLGNTVHSWWEASKIPNGIIMNSRRRTEEHPIIKVVRIKSCKWIFPWLLNGWTNALVHEWKKGGFY
jgi:hypothetical protein